MSKIEDKFRELHKGKPEIYEAFKKVIFQLMNRGYKHYSADGVFHIVRFTTSAKMEDAFKINNNYVSLYARMFADDFPQYSTFFKFKPLKAA